jgi:hypothetical protein
MTDRPNHWRSNNTTIIITVTPSAPEEEEITIPEDLKLPRIYGNERDTSA